MNEDIKRIRLIERNYESLQNQIYSIEGTSFTLKYKDDEGDQVTIASQQELEEALKCIENNLLHLKITVLGNENGVDKEIKDGGRCGKFRRWKDHCKRWRNHQNQQKEEKIEDDNRNGDPTHLDLGHPFPTIWEFIV